MAYAFLPVSLNEVPVILNAVKDLSFTYPDAMHLSIKPTARSFGFASG
jgi:hypothetical protein